MNPSEVVGKQNIHTIADLPKAVKEKSSLHILNDLSIRSNKSINQTLIKPNNDKKQENKSSGERKAQLCVFFVLIKSIVSHVVSTKSDHRSTYS
mmetsp:Transcript_26296/g.27372  ORF Transcript_26296/g.27372 Transcript_26296/m.27372 type:complete len:94 (-) Transcript_26296:1191-1472(-)